MWAWLLRITRKLIFFYVKQSTIKQRCDPLFKFLKKERKKKKVEKPALYWLQLDRGHHESPAPAMTSVRRSLANVNTMPSELKGDLETKHLSGEELGSFSIVLEPNQMQHRLCKSIWRRPGIRGKWAEFSLDNTIRRTDGAGRNTGCQQALKATVTASIFHFNFIYTPQNPNNGLLEPLYIAS